MAHLAGTADEIRAAVPAVLDTHKFIRDNVLVSGLVDPALKELCFRYLAEDPAVMERDAFEGRERAALDWAHWIGWDLDVDEDELWARLRSFFDEPELVDLGCAIGFELGQQHWRRAVGLHARDS